MAEVDDYDLPPEMRRYVDGLKLRLNESAKAAPFMGFRPEGVFYPLIQRHVAQFVGLHSLANLAIDWRIWERYDVALRFFEDLGDSIGYFAHPCRPFDPLDLELGPESSLLKTRVSSLFTFFAEMAPDWAERVCRFGDLRRRDVIRLHSKALAGEVGASLDESSRSASTDEPLARLMETMAAAAGDLLILAHAATTQYRDQSPLWEFLRHCRNAAAHGGRFFIDEKKGEPRRPAEWRGFRIELSLQGKPLIETPATPGFLGRGDPIVLLHDLEAAFPQLIRPSP